MHHLVPFSVENSQANTDLGLVFRADWAVMFYGLGLKFGVQGQILGRLEANVPRIGQSIGRVVYRMLKTLNTHRPVLILLIRIVLIILLITRVLEYPTIRSIWDLVGPI